MSCVEIRVMSTSTAAVKNFTLETETTFKSRHAAASPLCGVHGLSGGNAARRRTCGSSWRTFGSSWTFGLSWQWRTGPSSWRRSWCRPSHLKRLGGPLVVPGTATAAGISSGHWRRGDCQSRSSKCPWHIDATSWHSACDWPRA